MLPARGGQVRHLLRHLHHQGARAGQRAGQLRARVVVVLFGYAFALRLRLDAGRVSGKKDGVTQVTGSSCSEDYLVVRSGQTTN